MPATCGAGGKQRLQCVVANESPALTACRKERPFADHAGRVDGLTPRGLCSRAGQVKRPLAEENARSHPIKTKAPHFPATLAPPCDRRTGARPTAPRPRPGRTVCPDSRRRHHRSSNPFVGGADLRAVSTRHRRAIAARRVPAANHQARLPSGRLIKQHGVKRLVLPELLGLGKGAAYGVYPMPRFMQGSWS